MPATSPASPARVGGALLLWAAHLAHEAAPPEDAGAQTSSSMRMGLVAKLGDGRLEQLDVSMGEPLWLGRPAEGVCARRRTIRRRAGERANEWRGAIVCVRTRWCARGALKMTEGVWGETHMAFAFC